MFQLEQAVVQEGEKVGHLSLNWKQSLTDRQNDLWHELRRIGPQIRADLSDRVTCVLTDAFEWIAELPPNSIHAVVTDPPYSLIEYNKINHEKMKSGQGGVWRIPPSFDGANRKPLPRFTILSREELDDLAYFFNLLGQYLMHVLTPGGHLFIASTPLLSSLTFHSLQQTGLEKRGEIIRLVQTLRGGDRPKGAENEFPEVSMMARSCWEPWGLFRKPLDGTAAETLRRWGTGGLRRISENEPFKDVIPCSPARGRERSIAPHPSLKPQKFLRRIVRAALPLGIGIIYDPFAGSGSTLAAAEALGHHAIGTEREPCYYDLLRGAFKRLSTMEVRES